MKKKHAPMGSLGRHWVLDGSFGCFSRQAQVHHGNLCRFGNLIGCYNFQLLDLTNLCFFVKSGKNSFFLFA